MAPPMAPTVPALAPTVAPVGFVPRALLDEKDSELSLAKSVLVVQEEKLAQAAQYVAYQETALATLTAEVAALRQQLAEHGDATTSNAQTQSALEQTVASQELKLEQAKGFIAHQQQEIEDLQSSLGEFQTKMLQAKEYIDYQI